MNSKVFCLVLFCSFLPLFVEASPVAENKDNVLQRLPRQSMAVCEGTNNTGCLPDGVSSAPTRLVSCNDMGECVCNDCFLLDDKTGRCHFCEDYPYMQSLMNCSDVDQRQKQHTALLLSVFLSWVGAANFYIDQNGLAGGQLFIFIFLLVLTIVSCFLPCGCAWLCSYNDVKKERPFVFSWLIVNILVVLGSLATVGWWIGDLVIFARNQRLSGNGCVLA